MGLILIKAIKISILIGKLLCFAAFTRPDLFLFNFLLFLLNNNFRLTHKKPHLPTKTCPICERPFTWRKKWAKDWDQVIYCSDRCRKNKNKYGD
ncbi:DUF2256 domain-containing protein [Flagellimonas sp.]|uniref:DUF2256 domain-containing protein n=1 Tax=Flagellimonas sp. TaxID=2058762 RepID=UPI003BA86457